MKKYSIILAISLLTLLAFVPNAQHTITGTLTSAEDGTPIPGVNVLVKGTSIGIVTDMQGTYRISAPSGEATLIFSAIGYATQEVQINHQRVIDIKLQPDIQMLSEVVVMGYAAQRKQALTGAVHQISSVPSSLQMDAETFSVYNTEEYEAIHENTFLEATKNPLSTFSIDVDAASYSNIRRFINQGQLPPKDAVRIEEMVNYFHYGYPQPEDDVPFSISTEISACPWNIDHQLIHIGLQGKEIPTDNLPPSNLVFLIDVSGSMNYPNKLPLLKSALHLLVNQLREEDRVAIVVYAGAAGVVLPSTPGSEKEKIMQALDQLQAGGSTAGGEGIRLAYQIAKEHFREGGNNRVILATDGDFNVGESSNAAMERLVEEKRKDDIFLTVLGFGMGNYKDSKMEILADKGNGNYAYIDNMQEAQKVLVSEFGGTMFTIAKDVKIQVEFNPAKVKAYRLVGYENRTLKNEDFHNDKKDAGELGSGHTVTAMYEIIPAGGNTKNNLLNPIDELKYQQQQVNPQAYQTDELMTLKLRYKYPNNHKSQLMQQAVMDEGIALDQTSDDFRFAAAVAGFGMLLRDSEFKGDLTYDEVVSLAKGARGEDLEGYRLEFIRMVESYNLMASK